MNAARRWVIGRSRDCDIVVNSAGVAGRHCCLTDTGQGFVLEDLGSASGTFVNGTRITAQVPVSRSDRVTLGANVPMPWPSPSLLRRAPGPLPATDPDREPTRLAPAPGGPRVLSIGRARDNDIQLDYPTVSARHARLILDGAQARLEDLGSTNGTAVGHPDRKITQAVTLAQGDTIFFGSLRVPAARLLTGTLALGEQPHQTVTFRGDALVFGREDDCDQVINSPLASRRHARLRRSAGGLVLEDLGSTNGTFVNGRRVRHATPVRPGDRIGLAGCTFTVNDAGRLEKRDLRGNITLEARHVSVDVPGRRLIEDISLTIYPSEFVGLMGTSGGGKTTLLNALNGYTPPSQGAVLLNGQSLYANYRQFAGQFGYVPQDDIMHRELTVGQALYYSARLRLPRDYRDADIRERIARVLDQLDLRGTEGTLIGSPEKKGISGGQRRRVSLAMELLTDPLVLFLDEPTSGLSSEDALLVMQILKRLAESGKTILVTIHQPSPELFRLMTHLAVLSRDANSPEPGRLVYFGPTEDAIPYFKDQAGPGGNGPPAAAARARCPNCAQMLDVSGALPASPEVVLRALTQSARAGANTAAWEKRFAASPQCRQYVTERAGRHTPPEAPAAAPPRRTIIPRGVVRVVGSLVAPAGGPPRRAFGGPQLWTLVRRCLAVKAGDRANLTVLLVTAVVIGCLAWLVFGKQVAAAGADQKVVEAVNMVTFILTLAGLWFGTTCSIREVVGEWAIYRRERMVSLGIVPYVASKLVVLGAVCLVQCLILLAITHWGCQLKAPWWPMFAVVYLTSLVGVALGLTVSALCRTPELAGTTFTLVLLSMSILSGVMMPVHEMTGPMPAVCAAVPARWAFEALLVLEAEPRPRLPAPPPAAGGPASGRPRREMDMADARFPGDKRAGLGGALLALGVLLLVFVAAVHLVLRARDTH